MSEKTKIAVLGGGIVGATTAFYLSQLPQYDVTLFDSGTGQATSAAAGIICPWLSQRRNKQWYQLAAKGAAFYPQLIQDLGEDPTQSDIYRQVGTLVFKKTPKLLSKLEKIALKRREDAPTMGEIAILSPAEIKEKMPLLDVKEEALFASGGAKVDGALLTTKLKEQALKNGAAVYHEAVTLSIQANEKQPYHLKGIATERTFDKVVLAVGAWLPELLEPLGYQVDIRPQKGQLVELHLDAATDDWPVVMPDGEKDIIPFANGKVIVGATHENDQGYDLEPTKKQLQVMLDEAIEMAPELADADIKGIRVGTRAYTSDFAPFFGEVPESSGLYAASGLGSSGLTSGPMIAKILVQLINGDPTDLPVGDYPIEIYITQ
ncbi:FAD-binding oxidoreductase [Desemzia sp. RIT804]|uniref:NAD(P)/FAD-dependent oxidoreductase n=1 Tax=Desemzia sp. RIT 804 TaxID=2810209 RepID=UPI00195242B2|nr:FAD-dependent oxidoreductase [Desemzia sp. RIT 804]MBM6615987.1 FAD-binding oxidoreductase [Desemzia sp. RIT 804]